MSYKIKRIFKNIVYHKNYILLFVILFVLASSFAYFLNRKSDEYVYIASNTTNYTTGTDSRIEEALTKLQVDACYADKIFYSESNDKKVKLIFEGLPSAKLSDSLLDCLDKYDIKATFFITGIQAAENSELVKEITARGHTLGNYTLNAQKYMQNQSIDEIINDIARAQSILFNTTGIEVDVLRFNTSELTDDVLKAVGALKISKVIITDNVLDINSFKSYDQTLNFINSLEKGDIISIKLNELIDKNEYDKSEKSTLENQLNNELNNESDKRYSGTNERTENSTKYLSSNKQRKILNIVEWIGKSLENTNYKKLYSDLRNANDGKKAHVIGNIKTTDRAVSVMFTNLGVNCEKEILPVINTLKINNWKATFFATTDEIKSNLSFIKTLIDNGHEIGISVKVNNKSDYYDLCYKIESAHSLLKDNFGYDAQIVNQPWGAVSDELLEAISAYSMKYIKHDVEVKIADKNETSLLKIVNDTFAPNVLALKRGQSILFKMNQLNNKSMLAETLDYLVSSRTTYSLKTISEILNNKVDVYTYPLLDSSILDDEKKPIYSGHLGDSDFAFNNMLNENYIGNIFINNSDKLPGFSDEEIEIIDKSGKIENKDNAIFLTFDDWGSDIAIDKILQVLKKHNIKATFFVRTNYVKYNPNLLRAIAKDGHDIASHSHNHLTLSDYDSVNQKYLSLSDSALIELNDDLEKSYYILQNIIGDISFNGKAVLKKYFRPPTLAVSKDGIKTALDLGYTYIIEGDFSTQDYAANSLEQLTDKLFKGIYSENGYLLQKIESGSIIVMHMSDASKFTAKALDIYITANEKKSDSNPTKFKFAKISDYLD